MYLGLKMKTHAVMLEANRIAKGDIDEEIAILGITKELVELKIAELEKQKRQERELLMNWAIGEDLK